MQAEQGTNNTCEPSSQVPLSSIAGRIIYCTSLSFCQCQCHCYFLPYLVSSVPSSNLSFHPFFTIVQIIVPFLCSPRSNTKPNPQT
ncbi:Uncharacterized protein HZ326_14679 [Fusarium oxysporum f. sp. albedinis]|nr:Uncharacterized protein HZ326_14679 [Fusarium oxysporum f. sp. albedinis]